ncbi:MAG: H/ACA snoRNP pseudouridylase subunit [Caeruleum heppii]|nr:MAG: H/ACA snoRNP pseudouridylase subunit [Caeruleum heppii]
MSFRGSSRGRSGGFSGSRGGGSYGVGFGGRGGGMDKFSPAVEDTRLTNAVQVEEEVAINNQMGSFVHACEGEMVCESINPKIPYFNAPIFLENKTAIGKVDEILGPLNQVYFTIKPQDGIVATSFKFGDKFYIGGDKLLPLEKYVKRNRNEPVAPREPWVDGAGEAGEGLLEVVVVEVSHEVALASQEVVIVAEAVAEVVASVQEEVLQEGEEEASGEGVARGDLDLYDHALTQTALMDLSKPHRH